uniref:Nuclear export mediator factor NEMF n=1 Tax=Lygus hesperus TaxID=30085 RepID=A0A0A9XSW0_LYGHE
MHADVHGAASIIIKNPQPNVQASETIPTRTLQQAAVFTLVHSKIWNQRQMNERCYWVFANQVSKIPPTGMYLSPGSFMIRGVKNYIVQVPVLTMGLGLCFRLGSAASIENHADESVQRSPYLSQVGKKGAIWEEVDDGAGALTPATNAIAAPPVSSNATSAARSTGGTKDTKNWASSHQNRGTVEKKKSVEHHSRVWKERMKRYELQDEDDRRRAQELYGIVFSKDSSGTQVPTVSRRDVPVEDGGGSRRE